MSTTPRPARRRQRSSGARALASPTAPSTEGTPGEAEPVETENDNLRRARQRLTPVERSTLKQLNEYLVLNPTRILTATPYITSGADIPRNRRNSTESFNSTYTTFKQIRKEFMASVMVLIGSAYGISQQVVDKLDEYNPKAIKRLSRYLRRDGQYACPKALLAPFRHAHVAPQARGGIGFAVEDSDQPRYHHPGRLQA